MCVCVCVVCTLVQWHASITNHTQKTVGRKQQLTECIENNAQKNDFHLSSLKELHTESKHDDYSIQQSKKMQRERWDEGEKERV